MKHNFELDNSKSSFYVEENVNTEYIMPLKNIETKNNSILLNEIIEDFNHSSEEEIESYKPLLNDWLKKIDYKDYLTLEIEKIRHSIYEMF